MSWITAHPAASLTYVFLYSSVLLLWLPGRRTVPNWSIALSLSVLLGLFSHLLDPVTIIPITLMAFASYYSQAEKSRAFVRWMASVAVIVLSAGLATHQFPGFNNLNVLDHVRVSKDAVPYTFYLNIDKTIVGIFILGFSYQLIFEKDKWFALFKKIALKLLLVISITIVTAFALGFVTFDFKIPNDIFIWAITNLLFVCVAEEALFRTFIQNKLSLKMKKMKYGDCFAVLSTAILFGLVHYPGGIKFAVLAMVAGIGYGWVYAVTKRVEASIITHFGLNLTHILFFTYPALQGSV
jgi:membrane protease YdiL (CAAX protease family)